VIGACICFAGIITGIVSVILWLRDVNRVDLKPRVIINPPSNKSTTEEDISVICPNCDEEVNVGTDEDDLYECPHCSEKFEF
jgi:DNA-directed RNA polymerase subunit RPC12/RpoP